MQKILLGGFVDEEIAKINANFEACEQVSGNVPTKTSELTNDSGFVTDTEVTNAINQAVAGVDVPTKTSDLTNDSGYVTDANMTNAINAAVGAIDIPTKTSDLQNDSNFVKSTDTSFVNKVDKVSGKDLSTNDYTNADKAKVAKLGKVDFTTSNFALDSSDNLYKATLAAAGKYPVAVMRSNGSTYEACTAHVAVSGDNMIVTSDEAFAGYVVTI